MCDTMATGSFIPALPQFSPLGIKHNNGHQKVFTSNPSTDSFCGFGQAT